MYLNVVTSGCWNRVFVCTDPACFFICVICHWVYTPESAIIPSTICKLSIIQRLELKTYLADTIKNKTWKDLEHVSVSCDRQSGSVGRTQIRKQRTCALGPGPPLPTSQVMFLHMQRRGKSKGLRGNVETQMRWWATVLWSNTGLHIWYIMIYRPRWASQVVLVVKNLPAYAGDQVASGLSDSVRPHGLQPTRLLCPWDFPGENTGVGIAGFLNECFPEGHSVGIPCVYVCRSMYPDVGMVMWDGRAWQIPELFKVVTFRWQFAGDVWMWSFCFKLGTIWSAQW